jgi:serine/threonine protein kinase
MKPDRWKEIENLYQVCISLPQNERARVLAGASADEEIRREVESLLAQHENPPSFLERRGLDVAGDMITQSQLRTLPGRTLGPYEVRTLIGAGGMGNVYLAEDSRLGRKVALKVLSSELLDDSQFRARFLREARSLSRLSHPHICVLHDIGNQDGIDFLVMEHVEGETLADRLKRGPVPLDQALRYAIEIADALDAAHRQGITHRDLKPANVMLTKSGAKLLDFGLAKMKSKTSVENAVAQTSDPTTGGMILGTLPYMAPEQLEGKETDARTDIFAFGAVLYETITGQKPFQGESQASLLAAILEHDPPPMSRVQPITPAALDRVVQICMAKDPDDRWQTAREVLRELKWSGDAAPVASPTSATIATPSRRNWLWMFSLLGSVAAGIILTVLAMRTPPQESRPVRFAIPSPSPDGKFGPAPIAPDPAISPDGRRIAMQVPNESGRNVLWLRSIDVVDAQPLRGTEGAGRPFWSPDSRFIGFFADGKLKKIDVTGGPPQTLSHTSSNEGATWNRDGTILWGSGLGLFRVSDSGGQAIRVTPLDAVSKRVQQYWPTFLPDGKRFLYVGGFPMKVYAGSLDSNETKELTLSNSKALYASPGYLLFVTDGTLVAQPFDAERLKLTGEKFPIAEGVRTYPPTGAAAFSVSDNGILTYRTGFQGDTQELVWFDRSGKRLETVGPLSSVRGVEISPDQKRVAVHRHEAIGGDIWLMDLLRADAATRFTFNAAKHYLSPVWSPDQMSVVFTASSPGGSIYLKNADGTGSEQELFKSGNPVVLWSWSRDGRYLIYDVTDPRTGADLWILPMSGDRKPTSFLQTDFFEHQAQFSPDGKSVVYTSNESEPDLRNPIRESGKSEVYVRSFPPGTGKWKVSTDGGASPRWRGDGKEIFFFTNDRKLWSVEVKSGPPTFDASVPKLLFQTRMSNPTRSWFFYDVAADGQRFLIATTPEDINATEPLTVVLNWHAGLTSRK